MVVRMAVMTRWAALGFIGPIWDSMALRSALASSRILTCIETEFGGYLIQIVINGCARTFLGKPFLNSVTDKCVVA